MNPTYYFKGFFFGFCFRIWSPWCSRFQLIRSSSWWLIISNMWVIWTEKVSFPCYLSVRENYDFFIIFFIVSITMQNYIPVVILTKSINDALPIVCKYDIYNVTNLITFKNLYALLIIMQLLQKDNQKCYFNILLSRGRYHNNLMHF